MAVFTRQLRAILYRHGLILVRSKMSWVRILLPWGMCMATSLALFYILKFALENTNPDPVTFSDNGGRPDPKFAIVYNEEAAPAAREVVDNLTDAMKQLWKKDTGKDAENVSYTTIEEFNKWVYNQQKDMTGLYLFSGLEIGNETNSTNLDLTILYNATVGSATTVELQRVLWRAFGFGDLNVRLVSFDVSVSAIVNMILPMMVLIGLNGMVNLFTSASTDDVMSVRRDYLCTCNLYKPAYWLGVWIIDYGIYLVVNIVTCAIYMGIGGNMYRDNVVYCLWQAVFCGVSLVLFFYIVSFLFTSPDTASGVASMILVFMGLAGYAIDIVRGQKGDPYVHWIYGLFPPLTFFSAFSSLAKLREPISFGEAWKHKGTMAPLVMALLDIPLYCGILALAEKLKVWIPSRKARTTFESSQSFFESIRNRQQVTDEARQAAQEAINGNPRDYAIRICQVSRAFLDGNGKPIAAVNNVSMGIRNGAMYGFLGANGAGKTTMMKMITKELPVSAGHIEVNGVDIARLSTSGIAMCPQFNDHLVNEMTINEQLKFFGMLYGHDPQFSRSTSSRFVEDLALTDHQFKTVGELSGGNARKLAIAVALLSPANIVLLDEPTSSLDPVARHLVHTLVNRYRGQKTFMLCTHLLGEAEALCDTISIMIKGSVFVVGTPQYLSSRFGTEWRVDILMRDDAPGTTSAVRDYMTQCVPQANVVANRPKNVIYSVPSNSIEIAQLFRIMKNAVEQGIGVKYFTCSSSTLEKIFLELVMRSEEIDVEHAPDFATP